MNYNSLIFTFVLLLFASCSGGKSEIDLVVFPDYCGGCVIKNFSEIKNASAEEEFNIYFDTTDSFILDVAIANNLDFNHVNSSEIASTFGDYANIVVIKLGHEAIELKTNELIEKGKHY
tara:strand:+ start:42151 stop:42507 length:357 start_codon:yes stop_codon:yes gene_type:complete